MFGPRTRISSLSPLGTSLSSMPGAGRPTLPARSSDQLANVTDGAVSVAPRLVIIIRRSPVVSKARRSRLSHTCCDRPAPAYFSSLTLPKKFSRSARSRSKYGSSIS